MNDKNKGLAIDYIDLPTPQSHPVDEEKKWCVYIHTVPSGKKYVGLTSKNPEDRWRNGRGYQGQMFEKAI